LIGIDSKVEERILEVNLIAVEIERLKNSRGRVQYSLIAITELWPLENCAQTRHSININA